MAWELHTLGADSPNLATRLEAQANYKQSHTAPTDQIAHVEEMPPPQTDDHTDEPARPGITTDEPVRPQRTPPPVEDANDKEGEGKEEGKEKKWQPEFALAGKVIGDPSHPERTADRTVFVATKGGGMILAAMDGVGSGGEYSEKPPKFLQRYLIDEATALQSIPSQNEGVESLLRAFANAARDTAEYQGYAAERFNLKESVYSQIGQVATAGILTRKDETSYSLTTLNLGDAQTIVYFPDEKRLQVVTTDHSYVAQSVREGTFTVDEAFLNPNRNAVYKTVTLEHIGRIRAKLAMGQQTDEISHIDIPKGKKLLILSVTDGFIDNMPPDLRVEDLNRAFQSAEQSGNFTPAAFVDNLLAIVRRRMEESTNPQGKPLYQGQEYAKEDDAGIAAAYYNGE